MNYQKIYDQIINRAKNRILESYTETHHIIPKSCGGTDEKENLVELTAREHFICHWLLTKIYDGEQKAKMIFAFWRMCNKNTTTKHKPNSKQYEIARKLYSELLTKKNLDRVEKGTHPFAGESGREMHRIMVENGTHPLLTLSAKRAKEGTHHAQGEKGSEFFKKIQNNLVVQNKHHFQNKSWAKDRAIKQNKIRVDNGTHNWQGGSQIKENWNNPKIRKRMIENISKSGKRRYAISRFENGKQLSEIDIEILINEGLIHKC